ncbi:unnamed protein product [Pleuronectes platessa]|uniref:Uncharacterized protein n=1 Tax=Pleuronectes platessa TaxID=8262 RepID=A0A9N7W089_PLEPL|nr:unnamed protein product [Pleuronectes platessa]
MRRASWMCWQRADQQLRRFPFMSGWTCSGMEVPGDFPVRRPHRGHRRDELALCGRHVGRRLCGQMNPIIDPNTRSGVERFVHLPAKKRRKTFLKGSGGREAATLRGKSRF